jgi:hypothetical protein
MFCVLQRSRSIYRDTFVLHTRTFQKDESAMEAASNLNFLVIAIKIACILLQVRQ